MPRNKHLGKTKPKKSKPKKELSLSEMYYIEAQYLNGTSIHRIAEDLDRSLTLIKSFVSQL